MRITYDFPRTYNYSMPIFDRKGRITERVSSGLENLLSAYVDVAKLDSKSTDNNIQNYCISRVYVVGSGARENKVDSDLDLLLMAPRLDALSANHMKVFLSMILWTDRPKNQAIDVFFGRDVLDIYRGKAHVEITTSVRGLLNKYNGMMDCPVKISI